ncbi:fibrobacter succinogenes major paralogous domain-containing protein [Algoriphagus sp. oki45]|uniref:fibrobacter succinogenes major paralogous domain-containing protein n=1 Tax=Algoriphagus sp. oki45 TaxID=3067294 RepID=UPI0027F92B2E|nr:fibrobacter succinogenes major paralogous domain-containing protein [Algoriphagus sp. oki45]
MNLISFPTLSGKYLLLVLLTFAPISKRIFAQEIIPEVIIGHQLWMGENLNVHTFRNGDSIPQARSYQEWAQAARKRQPAWCYFENKEENGASYGKLYNYFAVSDPRGLAPEGWRIPSQADWLDLMVSLGGKDVAGKFLKQEFGWNDQGNGTNSSGFSAMPGGFRELSLLKLNEGFVAGGNFGYWWSSTADTRTESVWIVSLSFKDDRLFSSFESSFSDGYSVRCVKD